MKNFQILSLNFRGKADWGTAYFRVDDLNECQRLELHRLNKTSFYLYNKST